MMAEATEELVRGRYRIVGKLGEGSQGITFDAIDQASGAPVAIKRFVVKGSKSWKDVELAEREATVLASLSHPALPAHVDHFEEGGALYLVMQKIEGENMASLVRRGGMLSQADVVRFLSDAASVLDYLHGRSPPVIHRDINPKNVIFRPDKSFAFVDFGAVRDKLKPEGGSTVVGTFGYMAPEQFQGRALPASDVYSVGATAIRVLTGVEPEDLPHRGLAIDVGAALGKGTDPGLVQVLSRMLDPDPDRRATSITPLLGRIRRAGTRTASSEPSERRRSESRSRSDRPSDAYGEHYEAARQRAREAREEAYWAAYETRGDARRVAREARRRAREMRGTRYRRMRGWPGPPFFLIPALGLNLAILVIGVVLGVVVPFVLVLLSIFFGKPLRDAAKRVREAGLSTREALARAQSVILNEQPYRDEKKPRVRVEPESGEEPSERARVGDDRDEDVVDTVGVDVGEDERRQRR
jgi:hypothetical protein